MPPPRPLTPPADAAVTIMRIGADGDGVGRLSDGSAVYLPGTLPGDRVRLGALHRHGDGWTGTVAGWIERSCEHAAPPCPHAGTCGGCALQHWTAEPYAAWKTGLLRAALIRAGFTDPPLAPLVRAAPGSRRRMDLAARRSHGGVVLGLHRARSATVIDLAACHVLHPALFALLAPLRPVLAGLSAPWRQASVIANLLDSGPDLLIRADADPTATDRVSLARFATDHDLPRIAWARGTAPPEPVASLRPATLLLSGVGVTPPPGAFLQATQAGETAIIAAVLAGLPDRLRGSIAEFHAGCGTLTFALARHAPVQAWEGNEAAHRALVTAASRSGLSGRIRAACRDLVRQPVQARELSGIAAAVLDPPHAGAREQTRAVAAAGVPVVILVSCNPAALTRDAAILHDAGYALCAATPIDQFLFSARLESVSVFRLPRR